MSGEIVSGGSEKNVAIALNQKQKREFGTERERQKVER